MKLVLLAGDQLSLGMASLRVPGERRVVMAELPEEARYVWHHPRKIAFIFSAMRHFAEALRAAGVSVNYYRFGEHSHADFESVLRAELAQGDIDEILLTEFGEWRLQQRAQDWQEVLKVPVRILEDDRFLCSRDRFRQWAQGRRSLRMEYFYREMRRSTGLLMEGDHPVGGRWNFDVENRRGWSSPEPATPPEFCRVPPDAMTGEVLALVERHFPQHPGSLADFAYAVTAEQAQSVWQHFLNEALPQFGDFQDAMSRRHPFLFHAVCAHYLNVGLLDPLSLCRDVEQAWRDGRVPLNAAEGFIRQIIGWREYVRGLYWLRMPDYAEGNALQATRPLPAFFWTGETRMACLRAVIGQTLEQAYAHHIQRLMVTGNFALLAGLLPKAVCEWYLAVYIDAFEWVELPNTHGMALYADGGQLASKPYAASGKYIDRMSDYCRHCPYDVRKTTGSGACPFNALYWRFLMQHRERLIGNPRMRMMYRTLDRWSATQQAAIRDYADSLLERLDSL